MAFKFVIGHRVRINWFMWILLSWMAFMLYANVKQIPDDTTQIPVGRIDFCLPGEM